MTKRHENRTSSLPDVDAILQFPPEVVARSSRPQPAASAVIVSPSPFAPVASISKTAAFAALPHRSALLRRKERPLIWLAIALTICVTIVWAAARYPDRQAVPRSTKSSPPPPAKARPLELIEAPVVAAPVAKLPEPAPPIEPQRERPRVTAPAQVPAPKAAAIAAAPAPEVSPAAFYGALAVDSDPEGAHVFVNGQPVGSTPLILQDVSAGSRVVRIVAEGYIPWSSAIRVVANQQTQVSATLKR
jgi:hypothetical protein